MICGSKNNRCKNGGKDEYQEGSSRGSGYYLDQKRSNGKIPAAPSFSFLLFVNALISAGSGGQLPK